MHTLIKCLTCHSPYPHQGTPHVCPTCHSPYHFSQLPEYAQDDSLHGVERFKPMFGLTTSDFLSLGEGNTPLLWRQMHEGRVGFKCEHLNPTGSYKDRGTVVLINFLLSRGCKNVVEDSSGNAGASLAAYCAAAGVNASIFVPAYASGQKLRQIEALGADLIKVSGLRQEAANKALQAAESGICYASHAYMPMGLLGIMTILFEIYLQSPTHPQTLFIPIGHGGLIMGVILGLQVLLNCGIIQTRPRLVGVQARLCAPLYEKYHHLPKTIPSTTIAEGVAVANPVHMAGLLNTLKKDYDKILAIAENEISESTSELAQMGMLVEPTSALVWQAYKNLSIEICHPAILILSGNGLKSL